MAGPDARPPLTVLYFTGWCRSGTTVLGNILNEIDGFFHAGELHYLWKNGVLRRGSNTLCGCGAELTACEVWSRVLEAVVPAGHALEAYARHVVAWQHARFRTRHTWRLLRASDDALRSDPAAAGYLRTLALMYRAIQDATGARVIVDTGKYASEAAALRRLPGIAPAIVQQVRDPRAVAHSWHRAKAYIPPRGALNSTLYWVGFNLAAEAVNRAHPGRSMALRYEDFIGDPAAAVRVILALLGEDPARSPVASDGTVVLGRNHTVTGNPDRFQTGAVNLRIDDRWTREMPRWQRALVTAAALPLMPRYGYL